MSEFQSKLRYASSNFLIINGKNLLKPPVLRSKRQTSYSSLDNSTKSEYPLKTLEINSRDNSFKHPTFDESINRNTRLSKLITSLKNSNPKLVLKLKKLSSPTEDDQSPLVKKETLLPSISEANLKPQKRLKLANINRVVKTTEQVYAEFLTTLQLLNGLEVTPGKKKYRFYVGSGNNSSLVIRVISAKKGWVRVFNPQSANLIWTQVKKKEIFELIQFSEKAEKQVRITGSSFKVFTNLEIFEVSPLTTVETGKVKVCNRLEGNSELCSKKKMFINMKKYYEDLDINPFTKIPVTFHLKRGSKDEKFLEFQQVFLEFSKNAENDSFFNNLWLVKPGELTNRGFGIHIYDSLDDIKNHIDSQDYMKPGRTFIIQKYIHRPLLYNNRKFDIRVYALLISYNLTFQCFFYQDGYLRTSVAEFSSENLKNRFIHLTNDAVQKKSANYGKYEEGNKLSYAEFQAYLFNTFQNSVNFFTDILPKIEKLVKDSVEATFNKLDPKLRLFSFEILGYDFMVDELFQPWLIEVNTNPCLALSGVYLSELIPKMLADAMNIVLDQLFPSDVNDFQDNRFQLIFCGRLAK